MSNIENTSPLVEQNTRIIAIDSGCAYIKMAYLEDGELKCSQIPAQATRGFAPVGFQGAGLTYIADDDEWHLNQETPENTQFQSYPYSAHNLALNMAALHAESLKGDLKLSTGIPVKDFYTKEGLNQVNIDRKKALFSKPSSIHGAHKLPFTLNCFKVCPEAVAAVVDFACDEKGQEKHDIQGSVAVVDIGGRTTDLSVVDRNFMASSDSISTLPLGCLDLYQSLEKALRDSHDLHSQIPVKMLEEACRTGHISLYMGSKPIDVSELVRKEKKKLVTRIHEEVERRFGDQHLTVMLYAGGGAAMFEEQLTDLASQGVRVLESPQYANVRGYWKIATFLTKEA